MGTSSPLFDIPVHGVRRESGKAYGNVFRAFRPRRAVSHPFAAANDDRLSGVDLMNCFASFHLQFTAQDDGVLVELRRLPRLAPTARARHLRDTKRRCS